MKIAHPFYAMFVIIIFTVAVPVFVLLCWSVPTLGSSAGGVGTGLGVCGDGVLCDDCEGGREEGEGLQDGVGVGSSATEKGERESGM